MVSLGRTSLGKVKTLSEARDIAAKCIKVTKHTYVRIQEASR